MSTQFESRLAVLRRPIWLWMARMILVVLTVAAIMASGDGFARPMP